MNPRDEFVQACKPFYNFDISMMTLTDPAESTDNNYLFTGTFFFTAFRLSGASPDLTRMLTASYFSLEFNRAEFGLYHPFKSWSAPNLSHDEILGLCILYPPLARDIFWWGCLHFWVFDNIKQALFKPSQWIGRFPTLVYFIKSRAEVWEWNPFNYLYACLEFLMIDRASPIGETSGKCRRFLMAHYFFQEKKGLIRYAASKYLDRLTYRYGTVGGLYSIYFGPTHPFTLHTLEMPFK